MERILMKWFKVDRIILYTVVVTLAACMTFRSIIIGIGFIAIDEPAPNGTYALMERILPIEQWGYLFLANAILYAAGLALFFWRKSLSTLVIMGLMGGVLMFVYVSASWEVSSSKIHTYGYILTLVLHLFVSLLGGIAWGVKRGITISSRTNSSTER